MKKTALLTAALAACMSIGMTVAAFAGTWASDATGWWWTNDDGSYPVSTWQWIDGNNDGVAESYYFNENGYLLVNTTTPDGYTVNGNGAWTVDGQVQTQGVQKAVREPGGGQADQGYSTAGYYIRDISARGDCAVINAADLQDAGTFYEGVATIYADYNSGAGAGTFQEPIRVSKECLCYWLSEDEVYSVSDIASYRAAHPTIRMFEIVQGDEGYIESFEDGAGY